MCPGEREANGLKEYIKSLRGGIQDVFEVPGSEFKARPQTIFVSFIPCVCKLNMCGLGNQRFVQG